MALHSLIWICGCSPRVHSAHSSYGFKGVETDSHEAHLATAEAAFESEEEPEPSPFSGK